MLLYRDVFNSLDELTTPLFTEAGVPPAARCHENFADESADNVYNEVVVIHRSQKAFKMPSSLNVDIL
jgi:hypothetical protein